MRSTVRGSFYVTRVADGEEHVIDRFDDRERAENFVAFLNEIAGAPRRLAMH
jgi:hypothetical protein